MKKSILGIVALALACASRFESALPAQTVDIAARNCKGVYRGKGQRRKNKGGRWK